MAVVVLGKAGSREMMAGSDLDLMLVYTHPPGVTESQGRRSLPASTWFIRAAHAFVAALTSPGPEGPLYAVDMRLRPSGNKGPVAVSLAAFRQYHAQDAWTWERMALTRARVVAGTRAITRRTEQAIADALRHPQDAGEDAGRRRRHARAAAARTAADRAMGREAAARRRQIEVEFIAQTLQLVSRRRAPDLPEHAGRAAPAGRGRRDPAGSGRDADPRGPAVADGPEHAAHTWSAGRPRTCRPRPRSRCCCAAIAGDLDLPALGPPLTRRRRGPRGIPIAGGGDHVSIAREPAGPGFHDAGQRRPDRQPGRAEGQAVRPVFLSARRHAGLHQGGQAFQEALPELAKIGVDVIGVSKDTMKPIEKFAEKYGLKLPARLRPRRQGGRGVWRVGREIDVRQEVHGHRPQHVPGRRGRQGRRRSGAR